MPRDSQKRVAAYVGSGQIGDWPASESSSYAFALAEAQCLNNRKAVEALRAVGPPPHTAKKLWVQRTWLSRVEGHGGGIFMWRIGRILLGGPESSIFDLPNLLRGWFFSLDTMWAEASALNLMKARARAPNARLLLSRAPRSLGPP
jgi:hypothetical protein